MPREYVTKRGVAGILALVFSILLYTCAPASSEETDLEMQKETETVEHRTESGDTDEDAPLALSRGKVRMLCHARLNDFEKEII